MSTLSDIPSMNAEEEKSFRVFNNLGKYYLNFASSQNKFRGEKKSFLQLWAINLARRAWKPETELAKY